MVATDYGLIPYDSRSSSPKRYDGRVAVVTGSGSGIGAAIVAALVAEGARVVACDLHDEISYDAGAEAVVRGDITDSTVRAQLLGTAHDLSGSVDALFNIAGIGVTLAALEIEDELWERVMDVNVNAMYHLCIGFGRGMVEHGKGAILNTASVAGLFGLPGRLPYVVSKHAVVGMTRGLAVEWAPNGVRVNALCPGFTESGMNAGLREERPEVWASRAQASPLGRGGRAEEQASTALFLNSDEASFTTGQISTVDGGQHALYSGYANGFR